MRMRISLDGGNYGYYLVTGQTTLSHTGWATVVTYVGETDN